MPITNNVEFVQAFDSDSSVTGVRILQSTDTPVKEFAAQCIAVEVIRSLLGTGMTVEELGELPQEVWDAMAEEATNRAKLNPKARVWELDATQLETAQARGGNYYELEYPGMIATAATEDRLTFRRTVGMTGS